MIKFLERINQAGILLEIVEGKLKLFTEEIEIDGDLINEIKNRKDEIVSYLIESGSLDMSTKEYLKIPAIEYQNEYTISAGQRRLWVLSHFENGNVSYNMPSRLFLDGNYDITNFKRSIWSVLERHEILRTVFREDSNGEVNQVILDIGELGFEIDYEDCRSKKNSKQYALKYIQKDSYQPFDLEKGPLLRVCLLQLAETEYILYYNMHHIISDGWSMDILSRDILAYYKYYTEGIELELPKLQIQYKDYSAWQLTQLETEAYKTHRDYWVDKLSQDIPLLDLPRNKQRPAIKTYQGQQLSTYLSKQDTGTIESYIAKKGGTLFMFLLASLKVLFYRYTGQKDIIIGTPIAGRDHSDLEDQIGFYVNTLALRNKIVSTTSFDEFYESLKQNLLDAYMHQMYPFDRLIEELDLNWDTSRSPLFDVMMILQNTNKEEEKIVEEDVDIIKDEGMIMSKFDISFSFKEVGNHIGMGIKYNTDVYDYETISRLIKHYKQLVSNIVSRSSIGIGEVTYLTESDRVLLDDFNATQVVYKENRTILDLFSEQVLETPNAIAVVYGQDKLTYRDLDENSTQLANYLIDTYSIVKNDLVGIQLDRSIEMLTGILGVLKSGGAYVSLDMNYPKSRVDFIQKDSNYKICIDQAFIRDFELAKESYSKKCDITSKGTDSVYGLYTSGSTGTPKGVLNSHAGLYNRLLGMRDAFEVTSEDVLLQKTPYTFDVSVWELLLLSVTGCKTVFAKPEGHKDPKYIADLIEESGVTIIHFVPSMLGIFLEDLDADTCKSLRHVLCGGESLSTTMLVELRKKLPWVRIHNLYGPTEATIDVTSIELTNIDTDIYGVSIGKPVENTKIYIVDQHLSEQPVGVPGELLIEGIQVAKGYLNRPDLNSEKFITSPFTRGERIYRTGDMAKWLPNGEILYIGRIDNQVKIRGNRIELGEIENVLLQKEELDSVAVVVKESDSGDKSIVAYHTISAPVSTTELREYLLDQLPSSMIPNYFVLLEEFPLTTSGKIDKKSLPDPTGLEPSSEVAYVAPRTEKEHILVTIWQDVLKRESIGVNDNFYDLGGDSIKSIQIVSRLRQKGYALKVADLMKIPVVSKLARNIKLIDRVIDQSEVIGEVSLTPIQRSFLLLDLYVNKSHYNQSVMLERTSAIDLSMLDMSLEYLVKHHDALRMVYRNEGEKWYQDNEGDKYKGYSLDFYDVSESNDSQSDMSELCDSLQSSIDIEKGPLVKGALFRLKDKDCILLVVHHLVIDGISWRILLEDLGNVYQSLEKQKEVVLPLKTDSFQYWSKLLNEYAFSEELSKERLYWEEVLSMKVPTLYKEEEAIDLSKRNIKAFRFTLEKETVELLQTKVHRIYNTEINDVLLTALAISVQKVFGNDRVVVDLEGHGREDIMDGVDITRTIGWFTSKYPVILSVNTKSSDYSTSLIEIKESLRKLPNKGIGYGILRYLGDGFEKDVTSSIVFNYLGDFGNSFENGVDKENVLFTYSNGYRGGESSKDNDSLGKKLDVSGVLIDGKLRISIGYNDSIYKEKKVSDLMKAYKNTLEILVKQVGESTQCSLTPSDLTYKQLSISNLSELNKNNTVEDVYKTSPLQGGLHFHWMLGGKETSYFIQESYRLRIAQLDKDNVYKSYQQLIARHAILRTGFKIINGELLQVVRSKVEDTFRYEDISMMATNEAMESYISDYRLKDKARGFEVEDNSLIRLSLFDLGEGEYEFIWSAHHILMDGWCVSILINEFYQLLISFEQGNTISLPEIVPYSAYIEWIEKLDKRSSAFYWRDYLSDYNEKATLPFKNRSVSVEKYVLRRKIIKIQSEQLDKLRKICALCKVTENTFIQSAWGYLLSRYSNTQDVVYGTIVSGRPSEIEGVENMVGLFINTIPTRIRYNDDMTVFDLLKKQQKESITGLDHHYLSLSEVLSESELGSDLFDHVFVFENYAVNELDTNFTATNEVKEKLSVVSREFHDETHYDFDILVAPTKESIKIELRYRDNVYRSEQVEQIQYHLENVISCFLEDPKILLKDISYLTEFDRVLLDDFNATGIVYRDEKTVLDLFSEQVLETPNAIAVVYGQDKLTYRDLDENSTQLANYLIDTYDIVKNDLIGIQLDRSIEMLTGILGVLKSGGAYVPLDMNYPKSRIDFIQKDSNYKICIDQAFITDFELTKESYSKKCNTTLKGTDSVYGIYTSGSTGTPKGVLNSHAGLYNRLLWMRDSLDVTTEDVLLQKTPYTFDVSVWELLLLSVTGCKTVFAKPEGHKDPKYLAHLIEETGVTIIHFVPSMLGIFLEDLDSGSCKSLRHVVCSGESLPTTMVAELKRKLPWVRIHNLYGPTEAAIDVTSIDLTHVDTDTYGVSIGKPVENTKIFIVDQYLSEQPVGVPGELLIEGIQVAKGYLNRPDLNSEKFITSPFTEGSRVYRTGDLAKWLPNGEISYIGRIDNQVKIRGNRIELGEIENRIKAFEYVENVAVLVKAEESYRKFLVGYILVKKGYVENSLYDYLSAHLLDYMIPNRLIILEEFPLTISGKIDRKAFPDLNDNQTLSEQYVAPRNDLEEELVAIWKEVLRAEVVGVQNNFFRIGGDSLLVVKLKQKLEKKFNVTISIVDFFNHTTVEEQSKLFVKNTEILEEEKIEELKF